jgi:hypothetical protein
MGLTRIGKVFVRSSGASEQQIPRRPKNGLCRDDMYWAWRLLRNLGDGVEYVEGG